MECELMVWFKHNCQQVQANEFAIDKVWIRFHCLVSWSGYLYSDNCMLSVIGNRANCTRSTHVWDIPHNCSVIFCSLCTTTKINVNKLQEIDPVSVYNYLIFISSSPIN